MAEGHEGEAHETAARSDDAVVAHQARRPHAARNLRIEVLRLVAILAIFVFHTFQASFADAVSNPSAYSSAGIGLLGCINLLGSYGNHVFYMISGFFLIPQACRYMSSKDNLGPYMKRMLRKVRIILFSIALYAAVALLADVFVTDIPRVSLDDFGWLVGGLEFIWVYLAFVAVSPLVGWLIPKIPHARLVLAVLALSVFAVNFYIAFISPGQAERGLLEWRKLMSAVTYFVGFLLGGALSWSRPRRTGLLLALVGLSCAALMFALAFVGRVEVLTAFSYKSTSILSFVLAACSLTFAARPHSGEKSQDKRQASVLQRAAGYFSSAILGVYIGQSVFSDLWREQAGRVLDWALGYGELSMYFSGLAYSIALLAVFMLSDRLTRVVLIDFVENRKSRKQPKS